MNDINAKFYDSIEIDTGENIPFNMANWPVYPDGKPVEKSNCQWNGSFVVVDIPSEKVKKYRKKQFKKLNGYISQNICYVKTSINFGQIITQFNNGITATYSTNLEVDLAVNAILVFCFDEFDFNGGSF